MFQGFGVLLLLMGAAALSDKEQAPWVGLVVMGFGLILLLAPFVVSAWLLRGERAVHSPKEVDN